MENNNNGNNGLLSILTREGVLLKVSVHYWRGCKKLRPEDIGLEKKNLSDQLISLGHKRLLPKPLNNWWMFIGDYDLAREQGLRLVQK